MPRWCAAVWPALLCALPPLLTLMRSWSYVASLTSQHGHAISSLGVLRPSQPLVQWSESPPSALQGLPEPGQWSWYSLPLVGDTFVRGPGPTKPAAKCESYEYSASMATMLLGNNGQNSRSNRGADVTQQLLASWRKACAEGRSSHAVDNFGGSPELELKRCGDTFFARFTLLQFDAAHPEPVAATDLPASLANARGLVESPRQDVSQQQHLVHEQTMPWSSDESKEFEAWLVLECISASEHCSPFNHSDAACPKRCREACLPECTGHYQTCEEGMPVSAHAVDARVLLGPTQKGGTAGSSRLAPPPSAAWDERNVTWYTRPVMLPDMQPLHLFKGHGTLDQQLARSGAALLLNVTRLHSLSPYSGTSWDGLSRSSSDGSSQLAGTVDTSHARLVSIALRADGEGQGRGSGDKTLFYAREHPDVRGGKAYAARLLIGVRV